jgi:glycosyltransferase involved in cell wall biosynthesis
MFLTVITPCYNSTRTLRRTYESLLAQTYQNFEWILVDDYSSDDGKTRELIKQLSLEAPFPVKYQFLENNYFGSKSVFTACDLAQGTYACILDHDDELTKDSLKKVALLLQKYSDSENIAGVCGRCVNENGDLIGQKFNVEEQIATEGDIRFRHRITDELFQFTRIDLMKYWFQKMKPGYTNGFVWSNISNKYNYVYTNEIFRKYDTALPTSTSNDKKYIVFFPEHKAENTLLTLLSYQKYIRYNYYFSLRMARMYVFYCLIAKQNIFTRNIPADIRFLILLSYPLGLAKYLRQSVSNFGDS